MWSVIRVIFVLSKVLFVQYTVSVIDPEERIHLIHLFTHVQIEQMQSHVSLLNEYIARWYVLQIVSA